MITFYELIKSSNYNTMILKYNIDIFKLSWAKILKVIAYLKSLTLLKILQNILLDKFHASSFNSMCPAISIKMYSFIWNIYYIGTSMCMK